MVSQIRNRFQWWFVNVTDLCGVVNPVISIFVFCTTVDNHIGGFQCGGVSRSHVLQTHWASCSTLPVVDAPLCVRPCRTLVNFDQGRHGGLLFLISWKSNICSHKVVWNLYIGLKNVNYQNISFPFSVFLGPQFMTMTQEMQAISTPFIPVPNWHPNVYDHNFHYYLTIHRT